MKPAGVAIATIDVGSNATRMRIFRVEATGRLVEIQRHRFPVQLGAGAFQARKLGEPQMASAHDALARAAEMAREAGATAVRAVATSAVREAANGADFINRVRAATGIDLRVISGDEEARLAALGAVAFEDRRQEIGQAGAYIIDIGGGSTELARADAEGHVQWHTSIALGAVRAANEWGPAVIPPDLLEKYDAGIRREIARALASPLSTLPPGAAAPQIAYALGGTPAALAELRTALHNQQADKSSLEHPIRHTDIQHMAGIISGITPEQLCATYGVHKARASLLLPGVMILRGAMAVLDLPAISPADRGICEGLAVSWMRERNNN